MIKSPFDMLGKTEPEKPVGEEVSGAFSCQERGCYSTVTEATLYEKKKLLVWECAEGHENKIEGFEIDG